MVVDMQWREHILDKRVGAIRMISSSANFKARKMIANGIFISKLIYLMPLWMGCEDYLVNYLQVCQNKVARLVTKLDRYTPTTVLLKQCGWMSVRQLLVYHSLVLLHRTVQNKAPTYLYRKIMSGSTHPNTRQTVATTAALAVAGILDQPTVSPCELGLKRKSWCWAGVVWYRKLPVEILSETNLNVFKTKLKAWVEQNVDS